MVILGIDPGIATTGWGVVEKGAKARLKGKDMIMLDYGCVITEPNLSFSERLVLLYTGINDLLREHKPDAFVVEELFFNTNVTTAITVGQARGVILLAAAHFGTPYFEYTPLQVKMSLTGYGRAEKKQMQKMVQMIFGLTEIPKPDDAADALAIAYCHGVSAR
ncbi:MAG: crossover junction endodeoxyribonuclease RuvC [bacterium]|nr:crossover junction endodeoxyribonuclease RuvC [bacterium]